MLKHSLSGPLSVQLSNIPSHPYHSQPKGEKEEEGMEKQTIEPQFAPLKAAVAASRARTREAGVLRHWLATHPHYSTDPADAKVLATEDEAKQYCTDGWRVDGPYVEEQS